MSDGLPQWSCAGVDSAGLCRSGGEITSTFDHPELVKIGHCKLIEEVMIGEDTLIHFSGVDMGKCCPNKHAPAWL